MVGSTKEVFSSDTLAKDDDNNNDDNDDNYDNNNDDDDNNDDNNNDDNTARANFWSSVDEEISTGPWLKNESICLKS